MSTYDGRKPEPPYPTPDDIESLRDDIESLRDDIESLRDDIESLREAAKLSEARARACEAVKDLLDVIEIPERNCSCHVSPPCSWCERYGGQHEAMENVKAALAAAEKGSA